MRNLTQRWAESGHDVTILAGIPNHPHGKVYPEHKLRSLRMTYSEREGKVNVSGSAHSGATASAKSRDGGADLLTGGQQPDASATPTQGDGQLLQPLGEPGPQPGPQPVAAPAAAAAAPTSMGMLETMRRLVEQTEVLTARAATTEEILVQVEEGAEWSRSAF